MEQAQGLDHWQRFVLGSSVVVSGIGDTAVWGFVKQRLIVISDKLRCVQVL